METTHASRCQSQDAHRCPCAAVQSQRPHLCHSPEYCAHGGVCIVCGAVCPDRHAATLDDGADNRPDLCCAGDRRRAGDAERRRLPSYLHADGHHLPSRVRTWIRGDRRVMGCPLHPALGGLTQLHSGHQQWWLHCGVHPGSRPGRVSGRAWLGPETVGAPGNVPGQCADIRSGVAVARLSHCYRLDPPGSGQAAGRLDFRL